jgi:hypothetical protein
MRTLLVRLGLLVMALGMLGSVLALVGALDPVLDGWKCTSSNRSASSFRPRECLPGEVRWDAAVLLFCAGLAGAILAAMSSRGQTAVGATLDLSRLRRRS